MCRNYLDYGGPRECAAIIVRECVLHGKSEGWCGPSEDQEAIEKICERFGVIYVDDFRGIWEPRKEHESGEH